MSAVAHEDANIAVPQSSTATFNNFKRFVFTWICKFHSMFSFKMMLQIV